MKKITALLASVLGLSAAVAEPIEIAASDKSSTVWVIYTETFTKMQDGYTALVAERDATGRSNENRMYVAVMRETCVNGHGSLYARQSQQSKWELMSTVTLKSPVTIGDVTANVLCTVGITVDKRSASPDKKKITI